MTNNVIHLEDFTELPSITELQSLLEENNVQPTILVDEVFCKDFLMYGWGTIIFPNTQPVIEIENIEKQNKHYYLDYSYKRKKGKFRKYK